MANLDSSFWTAVTSILATVHDVPVIRVTQANRYNWMNEYEGGNLPKVFWAVYVGDEYEEDGPSDGATYRRPLSIIYFRPQHVSSGEAGAGLTVEAAIEAKLSDARDAFIYYNGSGFQMLGNHPTRSIRHDSAANEILYQIQQPFISGGFEVSPYIGEYA